MRILYGAQPSPFVRKVRVVLAEKRLPYTWPRLARYVEHIHSRPSFKAVIDEERTMFDMK